MSNSAICLIILMLASCASSKKVAAPVPEKHFVCPEGGVCTLKIERNKRLEVKTFGKDAMDYELKDDPNTDVVRFDMGINMEQAAYDGGYREEIVFEVKHQNAVAAYTDKSLQDAKLLFGRYCFCRGQTGLYRVTQGKLRLYATGDQASFDLDFLVPEVPQRIKYLAVRDGKLQ